MHAVLDEPAPDAVSDALALKLQGWCLDPVSPGHIVEVEAWSGTRRLGSTRLLFARPDVSAACGVASTVRTGFSLLLSVPECVSLKELPLELRAVDDSGQQHSLLQRTVKLSGHDYRGEDWGRILDPGFDFLVKREHMYHSGPSLAEGSPEALELIRRYLPAGKQDIGDIGCGLGYYGRHLLADGHRWTGYEIKKEDCARLAELGLPHHRVDGSGLPCADGAHSACLCIEVLEHIPEPEPFLAEVRRVCSGRFLVSVPNLEVVPYWRPHLAVPWHLLESDHHNFFTRHSLRALLLRHFRAVEVIAYGYPPLRSREGATTCYNLFAIAEV